MRPLPKVQYEPQLEIVPVEPDTTKRDQEDAFWKENVGVSIDDLFQEKARPRNLPN